MPPQFQNNQTNVPENKPKRNYAFLLTLTFLLLLLGVFGVWYFSQVPPQDETEIVATKDQFADWKTYRNEEYGFEIKYPNNWNLREYEDQILIGSTSTPPRLEGDPGNEISIFISRLDESSNLESWLNSNVGFNSYNISSYTNPNNVNFTQIKEAYGISSDNVESYTTKEGEVFGINVLPASKFNEIYNQILSTFKFIPSQSKVTSGIRGTVTIGPTCPVQKNPPDPNCADRPFQAGFNVIDQKGKTVKSFSSDENGKFSADLAPGTYVIRNIPAPGTYPRLITSEDVTVSEGKYIELNLQFDSGIR